MNLRSATWPVIFGYPVVAVVAVCQVFGLVCLDRLRPWTCGVDSGADQFHTPILGCLNL